MNLSFTASQNADSPGNNYDAIILLRAAPIRPTSSDVRIELTTTKEPEHSGYLYNRLLRGINNLYIGRCDVTEFDSHTVCHQLNPTPNDPPRQWRAFQYLIMV